MPSWISENQVWVSWVVGSAVGVTLVTIVLVPVMLIRIPRDYFAHEHRPTRVRGRMHPALRVAKNVAGAVLIVAGLAMLLLPGQGLLTILVGSLLVDLPGKYRVEKWIVSRPRVLSGINWLRKKAGREKLRVNGVGEGRGPKGAVVKGA